MSIFLRLFASICIVVGLIWVGTMALLIRHVPGFVEMERGKLFLPAILAVGFLTLGWWLSLADPQACKVGQLLRPEEKHCRKLRIATLFTSLAFLFALVVTWILAFIGVSVAHVLAAGRFAAACYFVTLALGLTTVVVELVVGVSQRKKV